VASSILLQDVCHRFLSNVFPAIGLAAVGFGRPQRAQVPDAGLGHVYGGVAGGDGIHSAAQTEAGGGSGPKMRNRAARTEARGGGGGSGAEMRNQAEHVIAVMGELLEQCWRMKARKEWMGRRGGGKV